MLGKKNLRNKKIKISKTKVIISITLLVIMTVALVFADKLEVFVGYKQTFESHQTTIDKINQASYYVAYIDVGQGNSTFVELPDGKTVLVDGGDTEYGVKVGDFLRERNVDKIDYMIATHADSDHIGGLNYVLDHFEVENIYRPFQIACSSDKVPSDDEDLGEIYLTIKEANKKSNDNDYSKVNRVVSSVYVSFISKIYSETYTDDDETKESTVTVFYDGLVILGRNYEIEFFAPCTRDIKNNAALFEDDLDDDFEELESINLENHTKKTSGFATFGFGNSNASSSNDNSAIFTLTCFDDKYFFSGDATFLDSKANEGFSEYEFIDSLTDEEKLELADVDVIMLGHHGSKYSTSSKLLNLINPRFVVVSVGINSHGHPSEEVLDRVAQTRSLEDDYLIRTDQNGDIIFASVEGELRYYVKRQGTEEKLRISFRLLIVIITVMLILFVLMINVKKKKKSIKTGENYGNNSR